MKKKKGAFMQEGTAKWIILIISAVILLIATGLVLWKVFVVGEKACHYSIVLRSTFSKGLLQYVQGGIPLKCEEQKICFSKGGSCPNLGDKSKIKIINVKTEEDIYKNLAELHYDAHYTAGEGKLYFLGIDPNPANGEKTFCLITQIIDFDENIKQDKNLNLNFREMYYYMQDNAVPGKEESGLHYLYGINNFDAVVQEIADENNNINRNELNYWKMDVSGSGQYAIVIKMSNRESTDAVLGAVAYIAGAEILSIVLKIATKGILPTGLIEKGGMIMGGIEFVRQMEKIGDSPIYYVPPRLVPHTSEFLRSLKCDEFAFTT